MITEFKIFEAVHESPKKGDYVIIENQLNIGQIVFVNVHRGPTMMEYQVIFGGKILNVSMIDIKYWSDNKEELESILATIKYNI